MLLFSFDSRNCFLTDYFDKSSGNSGVYCAFSNYLCGFFLRDVINGGTKEDGICMLEDINL